MECNSFAVLLNMYQRKWMKLLGHIKGNKTSFDIGAFRTWTYSLCMEKDETKLEKNFRSDPY